MTRPRSVDEALHDLTPRSGGAVPVAGATWVMRAPVRHEQQPDCFVALADIKGFRRLDLQSDALTIGPLATHDRLARDLPATADLRAMRLAAGRAANPGIRRIATIGGNICSSGFAASDFAPALLSLDAHIEIADGSGSQVVSTERFLDGREARQQPWLITGIVVPRSKRLSAHERLPMRRAGDYPCAIVSLSLALDDRGLIRDARIGIGAVEAVARRWHSLEQALEGNLLSSEAGEQAARDLLGDFTGRDAVDAPGWYRTRVLPVLVRRALESILNEPAARAS